MLDISEQTLEHHVKPIALAVTHQHPRPIGIPRGKVCNILPATEDAPACVAMLDKVAEHVLLWSFDPETGSQIPFGDPHPGVMVRLQRASDGGLLTATRRCGEGYAELRLLSPGAEPQLRGYAAGQLIGLSDGGRQGVLVDREGGVSLWDMEPQGSGKLTRQRRWATRLFESKRWDPFVPFPVASPSGDRVAMVRGIQAVEMLDIREDAPRTLFEAPDELTKLLFNPDGTRLVTASFSPQVQVWDASSGDVLMALGEGDANVIPESLRLSGDGRWLFVTYDDFTFRLWDLDNPGVSIALDEPTGDHPDDVHGITNTVRFHPDGVHVLASHQNHVVHVWDRRSGAHVATWRGVDPVTTCACGQDGAIWIGDIEGRVTVLEAPMRSNL